MGASQQRGGGRDRKITGAGIQLALSEFGDPSRPTVILVHGFPDTGSVWDPLVELLSPAFHVVTYDVRGAGGSDVPEARADYALPLLVADLEAVAAAVSPDGPVHLVAHDWGSIQAWEAVTTDRLAGRFASYTSISGPPLDHAALWARRHRSWRLAQLRPGLRQATHSWYIAFFHLPVLPRMVARTAMRPGLWSRAMHRRQGVPSDATWPAPTLGSDFAHGVELYRANVRPRFRQPRAGHTDTPVQIIVPDDDHYVTPALLEGLDEWSSTMWLRHLSAGHWAIRTHPDEIAGFVRQLIAYTEDGTEAPELARDRLARSGAAGPTLASEHA